MLPLLIHTKDSQGSRKEQRFTQHHVQFMLSFIGVKHTHAKQVLDQLFKKPLLEHDRPLALCDVLLCLRELLTEHHYSHSLTDLEIAWRVANQEQSVCILLGGTSGCGKSTLANLLAHRMGITTVLSTDHVRSLLRSFDPEKSSNLLWASSYHAGEQWENQGEISDSIIKGYEAQNALLLDTIDKMIANYSQRNESLVIEGVALSIESMRALYEKHSNCIPLLIYISNEQKHAERFAIRAKYMTVAPRSNKYIHYFDNIRLIQQHLCEQADTWMIPKINNTNVDRSLAILHTTMINALSCVERSNQASFHDADSGKMGILHEEFSKVCESMWSSKQMLRKIRQNSARRGHAEERSGTRITKRVAVHSSDSSRPTRRDDTTYHELDTMELDHLDDIAWGSLAS